MTTARTVAAVLLGCALAARAHAGDGGEAQVDRLARGFIATLSETDIARFRQAQRDDLPLFHFGAGSRVRQLYFGRDGEGRRALCTADTYCDIDAQSMRIVERAWQLVHDAG